MKDPKRRVTQKDIDKVHKENKLDKKLGTDRGYREKPQLYKTKPSPTPKSGGPFSRMEPFTRGPKGPKEIVRSKAPEVLKKVGELGRTAKRVASSPAMSTVKRVASSPFAKSAIGAARMTPLGKAVTIAAGIYGAGMGYLGYKGKKDNAARKAIEKDQSLGGINKPIQAEKAMPKPTKSKVVPAQKKPSRPPQISGKEKILLDSLAEATGKGPYPYRPSKDKKKGK